MTTRTSRKEGLKEDIKHVIEDLWEVEEKELFCKIFARECVNAKGTQKILQCFKSQLYDVSCFDEDDDVHHLQHHEAGDFYMLLHYKYHLIAMELLPEDADALIFNSITRKDCVSFMNHPDAIASISSIGDITSAPPANIGLAGNFKVACSPSDSFNNYIERYASILLLLRKENVGTLGAGTSTPLLEHRMQLKY